MAKKTQKTTFQFESALAQLEQLVEQLEGGELSLEDALKTFEQGIRLTRDCQKALTDAEQKVKILLEKNGNATLQDMRTDEL